MASTESDGGGGASSFSTDEQSAYNDLKRLIPSLAAELELLRTSLREHSLWLLRYGHGNSMPNTQQQQPTMTTTITTSTPAPDATLLSPPPPPGEEVLPPPPSSLSSSSAPQTSLSSSSSSVPTGPPPAFTEASEPPAYSASDVPPYTGGFSTVSASTREEVRARRDQLTEWLREGEDVLREYSARYAQLAQELGQPQEDLLGTWHEAHPDNALPGYRVIEEREEFMVGGVGEVPPPYLGGRITTTAAVPGLRPGPVSGQGARATGEAAAAAGDPSSSSSSYKGQ